MNEIPQQIPNQPVEPQPQQQAPVEMGKKSGKGWLFAVIVVVVVLAAYAGIAFWQNMWPF